MHNPQFITNDSVLVIELTEISNKMVSGYTYLIVPDYSTHLGTLQFWLAPFLIQLINHSRCKPVNMNSWLVQSPDAHAVTRNLCILEQLYQDVTHTADVISPTSSLLFTNAVCIKIAFCGLMLYDNVIMTVCSCIATRGLSLIAAWCACCISNNAQAPLHFARV